MAQNLTLMLDRLLGNGQRVTSILVGVASVAVIWGLAQWGMRPEFVTVAAGLPMERIGEATQKLEEAGIEVRLEGSGSMISVPDRDAARARVALAAEGLTGSSPAPGFELFDQPSWGMTDFTQRVNYRRALEGELERTMGRMRGVESARVHLALRERSFLRSSEDAGEASVVLSLLNGTAPDESVVQGVQSLVASSVEGLARENVTVLDDRGRLLTDAETESGVGMTHAQLKVQTQIEQYLERKAESVIANIVGPGNATVRVAADLNFDRIDRTIQAVDPNQAALVSEQRSEIIPGNEAQGAGSLQTSTEFEATRSVETLSRGGARLERLTVAVVVSDREAAGADGDEDTETVFEPRSAEELQQIELLVANAVGLTPTRGDEISVVSAPFEFTALDALPLEEGLDLTGTAMTLQRPVIVLAALAVALFIAMRVLRTVSAGSSSPTGPSAHDLLARTGPDPRTMMPAASMASSPALTSATEPPRLGSAPRVAVDDPAMTARVLRSWMRES